FDGRGAGAPVGLPGPACGTGDAAGAAVAAAATVVAVTVAGTGDPFTRAADAVGSVVGDERVHAATMPSTTTSAAIRESADAAEERRNDITPRLSIAN